MATLKQARAIFEQGLDMDKMRRTLRAMDTVLGSKSLTNAEHLMLGLTELRVCLEDHEVAEDIGRVSLLIAVLNDILAENGGRIRIHWVAES